MSKSIKELTLDLKDYREGGTVFRRQAVRGIIRHKDRYLVIHGKYGDYKFPGGGRKRNVIKITGKGIQDIFFCITKAVA